MSGGGSGGRRTWRLASGILLVGAVVAAVGTAARRTSPDLIIRAVAHQWYWDFQYVGLDVRTRNALHVPAGRVVRLELGSADVVHSFWIPGMAEPLPVGPGVLQTLDLRFGRGATLGTCDAACGCGGGCMSFRVDAQPPARFERWWRRRVDRRPRAAAEHRPPPACVGGAVRPAAATSRITSSSPDSATICRSIETPAPPL